jgi:hypothetical protein
MGTKSMLADSLSLSPSSEADGAFPPEVFTCIWNYIIYINISVCVCIIFHLSMATWDFVCIILERSFWLRISWASCLSSPCSSSLF